MGRSLWIFMCGIFSRWFMWVPALLLDPLDIYNIFIYPRLPEAYRWDAMSNISGSWYGVMALIFLIFWAAFLTYYELRRKMANFSPDGAKSLHNAYQQGRLLVNSPYEEQEEWVVKTYNLINKLAPEMFCTIKNARPWGAEISDYVVIESKLDALTQIITEYHRRQTSD